MPLGIASMAIKSKKKLISNIIFYTFAALLYAFIAYELVCKFTGNNVYLFGNRFDVVLTDSMSAKNENHLDFLEGTSQIQPFDLVTSSKINKDTVLKEKDVVLFKNPKLNNITDMHRIVNITEKGDEITFANVDLVEFNNTKGIKFINYGSYIGSSNLPVVSTDITFLSDKPFKSNVSIQVGIKYEYPSEYTTTKISDNVYEHVVHFERTDTYPTTLTLRTTNDDFVTYITKWDITCLENRYIHMVGEDYVPNQEKTNFKLYNVYNLYEIRGDKAKDSDGIFSQDQLISKVTNVIPKLGYFARFISSIPGMILIIGLALIFTIFAYFNNKPPKTEKVAVSSKEGEVNDVEISKNDKQKQKEKKKKKNEKV